VQLEGLQAELAQAQKRVRALEARVQQLTAANQALHRRQFKGRHPPPAAPPDPPAAPPKQRGAPAGHPPWQRPRPRRIDHVVEVSAPAACPYCHGMDLSPVRATHAHVQADIVLEPRTVTTCFRRPQAHCSACDRDLWQPGPGELPGSYIGPAAKAAAVYLRYELNVSDRQLSRFFAEFFGLKFVPASA
jgi:hypothetical protein